MLFRLTREYPHSEFRVILMKRKGIHPPISFVYAYVDSDRHTSTFSRTIFDI